MEFIKIGSGLENKAVTTWKGKLALKAVNEVIERSWMALNHVQDQVSVTTGGGEEVNKMELLKTLRTGIKGEPVGISEKGEEKAPEKVVQMFNEEPREKLFKPQTIKPINEIEGWNIA